MNVYSSADTQTRNFTAPADPTLEIRCPKKLGQVIAAGRCLAEQAEGCRCPVMAPIDLGAQLTKARRDVETGREGPRMRGHVPDTTADKDAEVLRRLVAGGNASIVALNMHVPVARVRAINARRLGIEFRPRESSRSKVKVGAVFGVLTVVDLVAGKKVKPAVDGVAALLQCVCGKKFYKTARHLHRGTYKICQVVRGGNVQGACSLSAEAT